jgi:hypothetical protein
MNDFFQSILEASKDRLKNPVLGTYSISFILFNWQPISILLFSRKTIEEKITSIDLTYYSWETFLWPSLITIIIIFTPPFFMLLADIALNKVKNKRIEIRHNEKTINLDNQIIIATKEFEIQNRKSGTKTIETLQETISILEKEKRDLILSINSERDANLKEIKRIKELSKNEIEKDIYTENKNFVEFSEKVFDVYNQLQNNNQIDLLYKNFDGYSNIINLTEETIKYYQNLGLISNKNSNLRYTALGFELYHLLFESNNSGRLKRKMADLTSKINEDESDFLLSLSPSTDIFFKLDQNFRKVILNEMLDFDFLKAAENNSYGLTEKGIVFRNLVILNELA